MPTPSAPVDRSESFPQVNTATDLARQMPAWRALAAAAGMPSLYNDPRWLTVLQQGRGDAPYVLESISDGKLNGLLPLTLVSGPLFGRFLVALSHVSIGTMYCDNPSTGAALIDRAITLADELNVSFLELRHEFPIRHPALQFAVTDKVLMRLDLPATADALFTQLGGKVRNQIRKAERIGFTTHWGGTEQLDEFYSLYARRMRELGTPVDGRKVFEVILNSFPQQAELVVVRREDRAVASALVLHGASDSTMHRSATLVTERATAVNSWLHWQALRRAQEVGSWRFDLGCATLGSSVYTFKKRWGAQPKPLLIQHYVRRGSPQKFRRRKSVEAWISLWRRLPESVTRWLGPRITQGMP